MLEPSLCSKKTREYILNLYYLWLKWNGSDLAQTDYMMQSDQVLICLPPNTDSFYHNNLLTQFVQIAKDFWEEPNFVSTFSKSYKTRGSRYPGSLTWKFQALKAVLYVRTGYRVRSVAVRINPLQTLLIRTILYWHRSNPFFIRSAHALTRVVPYLTVSFSY